MKLLAGTKMISSMTLVVFVMLAGGFVEASPSSPSSAPAAELLFKKDSLLLRATFPAPPVVGQESLLVLSAFDSKTLQAVEIVDVVDVVLWMPSMGHGSAPTRVERGLNSRGNVETGVFNVKNVHFIMEGDWEVRVTLTDVSGLKETASFPITLAADGHGGHRPH